MSTSYQFDLLRTYRYLRLAMVLLVLLLFVSVTMYINSASGQMLQSISALVLRAGPGGLGLEPVRDRDLPDRLPGQHRRGGRPAQRVGVLRLHRGVRARPAPRRAAWRARSPGTSETRISNNVTALMAIAVVAFLVVMGIQVLSDTGLRAGALQGGRRGAGVLGLGVPGPGGFSSSTGTASCATAATRRPSCSSSASSRSFSSAGTAWAASRPRRTGGRCGAHFWNGYFWGFMVMVTSIAVSRSPGRGWGGWTSGCSGSRPR